MESTTRDFLKMIVDYKVSVIIMCCDLQENGMVCFMIQCYVLQTLYICIHLLLELIFLYK